MSRLTSLFKSSRSSAPSTPSSSLSPAAAAGTEERRVGVLFARSPGEGAEDTQSRNADTLSIASSPERHTKHAVESLLADRRLLLLRKLDELEALKKKEEELESELFRVQEREGERGGFGFDGSAEAEDASEGHDGEEDEVLFDVNDSSEDDEDEAEAAGDPGERPRVYGFLGTGSSVDIPIPPSTTSSATGSTTIISLDSPSLTPAPPTPAAAAAAAPTLSFSSSTTTATAAAAAAAAARSSPPPKVPSRHGSTSSSASHTPSLSHASSASSTHTPRTPSVSSQSSAATTASHRRMTEPHRPSSTRLKRVVTITRRTPNEPLGFTLRTVAVPPSFAMLKEGVDRSLFRQSTFVDNLTEHSLSYQAGMRRGDQILEVDGEQCEKAKHEHIQALLSRNVGSLRLTVRTTQDFFRACVYDELCRQQRALSVAVERLRGLKEEEAALQNHYRNYSISRAQRAKYAASVDLCVADVLRDPRLSDDLPALVLLMQQQWARERELAKSAGIEGTSHTDATAATTATSTATTPLKPTLVMRLDLSSGSVHEGGVPPQPPSDSEDDSDGELREEDGLESTLV